MFRGLIKGMIFTKEQIEEAHSKVKSGADFPRYMQDIIALGVTRYEVYVIDGHTDYHGVDGYTVAVPAKYDSLIIADNAKEEEFKAELKAHQQGKTDYQTFITMCASCGIEKWKICMEQMTCTYYDKAGHEILAEEIPGV